MSGISGAGHPLLSCSGCPTDAVSVQLCSWALMAISFTEPTALPGCSAILQGQPCLVLSLPSSFSKAVRTPVFLAHVSDL